MPYDPLVAQAVVAELRQLLGTRVDRIVQPTGEEIAVALYTGRSRTWLLFSVHAVHARLHLAAQVTGENRVTPFLLTLRHHLEGAQLREVSLPVMERVVTLQFQSPPIRGSRSYRLVAEIMGRHSNLILVDPETGLIIDGLKRYGHALSRYREVLPGRPYLAPPRTKADPLSLTEEQWTALLVSAGPDQPLEKALVEKLNGFGPVLARELAFRAGIDPTQPLEFCGAYEFDRLWQAWQQLCEILLGQRFEPTLVRREGRAVDYAALPLRQYQGLEQMVFSGMSAAIDLFYRERLEQEHLEKEKRRLKHLVGEQQRRWLRKLETQTEVLAEARKAEAYRLYGEIIIANLHRLTKGMTHLEAPNPYRPEETERVALDPALEPIDNAQWYFRRYRKAKTQAEQAASQLEQARHEIAYWESVDLALDRVNTPEELAEVREEIEAQLPSIASGSRRDRGSARQPLLLLRYTSPDGYDVLVGKNNRQNDYLCARVARSEDVWLHAQGVPGAHVLVRNPRGGPLPPRTLEFAASLAAYFSRSARDHLVAVDYTLAKYVHKPKGARPGMVFYTHQSTIVVPPVAPPV
ncbi:MAG: Rqc2 family fibronectin-binding protein [Moorellales bacterium]